jgi:hypothetical protein
VTTGNDKTKPSFVSPSDDDIIFKAKCLGISLGKNDMEISKAINSIKYVDVNGSLVL